jgi:luciferase family oxidoreductase group 1
MTAFSILDLCPIVEGGDVGQALSSAVELAQLGERLGFLRYWVAEHHAMPGVASAATAVVLAHVAAKTSRIRVGAGGIMLPNHAPLLIAEQFGTLEALHPGRIDLGLGRAAGSDPVTARALRRGLASSDFAEDVRELQAYFAGRTPVRAIPGAGAPIPLYVLGSSLYGAQLAAAMGLPFAFASHFAPDLLFEALEVYRSEFRASAVLERPYAMVGMNVFAAETDHEARRAFSSLQQAFVALRRGSPGPLPAPVEGLALSPIDRALVDHMLGFSAIGAADTVRRAIAAAIAETGADEIVCTAMIHDRSARLRSFAILAEAVGLRP